MSEKASFEASVRALAAEARRSLDSHLSPDELLDYQAGDVTADQRESLQEHLAFCPACTRALLDLQSFPNVEPVRDDDRLSDRLLAEEWQRFERGNVAVPRRAASAAGSAASPRLAWALAATLLPAVVGLSVWVAHLRQELAAPRADVYVADLVPRDEAAERSPAAAAETVRVPAWAGRVLLLLNLAEVPAYPEYRVEIVGAAGRTVWSRRGVQPGAAGGFTVDAPRRFLAPGDYVVRLSGLAAAGWRPVAEYVVRIEDEVPPA